ncbi:MAG: peptide MFS transporter, partial [Salinibacter sp.]
VFIGGCIIALGHFTMAGPLIGLPEEPSFFVGLLFIVVGTGLLKPNVSTMVGDLYPEGGARRDAGFSIFYMGINFGAILGPTFCSLVGEGYNWHWGFSLAGFGMLLGLISYRLGFQYLGEAGTLTTDEDEETISRRARNFYLLSAATAAVIVAFGFLMSSGLIDLTLKGLASFLGVAGILIVLLFFVYLILGRSWMLPTLLVAAVAFAGAYPFLDLGSFQDAAVSEVRGEIEEMVLNNRFQAQRLESVTGQSVGAVAGMGEDEVTGLVSDMSEGEVLTLADMSQDDLATLAWEKLYVFGAQIAVGIAVLFFLMVCLARLLSSTVQVTLKNKRLMVIFWLFLLAALFWSGFEQAGSSLNIFAKDLTDRAFGPYGLLQQTTSLLPVFILAVPVGYVCFRIFRREDLWYVGKVGVGLLSALILGFVGWVSYQMTGGWTMPASMLQNINPFFIVVFAPVFGAMWTWLAKQNANPSIPVKFALGLFGLSAGFFVLAWGAANATAEQPVTPAWLVVTYFLHTSGELCLSPVGLSSMTKLAPENRVGQMMGVWFVAAALGNLFAGLIAGQLGTLAPSALFSAVAIVIGGGGLLALLASPFVKGLMGDVE